MVGKYSILIVALFFGAMTGVLPRASTSTQKIVNPLFVKKPQLKLRYNYFVKMLAKHSPELKSSFEKAFSWGFRAAKRFTLDKQAEDQFLDELEADTKLAPVYKEALFSFSEDMNPSSWGKIILGTAGGIAAVVVLAATVMWYRDKRQAERERLAADEEDRMRQIYAETLRHRSRVPTELHVPALHCGAGHHVVPLLPPVEQNGGADSSNVSQENSFDIWGLNSLYQSDDNWMNLEETLSSKNLKQFFDIKEGQDSYLEAGLIASIQEAMWTGYCQDMENTQTVGLQELQSHKKIRDTSIGACKNLVLWQTALRALANRLRDRKISKNASFGILNKMINGRRVKMYYLCESGFDQENPTLKAVSFFDQNGFPLNDIKSTDVLGFEFCGRIANMPGDQKLTDLFNAFLLASPVHS